MSMLYEWISCQAFHRGFVLYFCPMICKENWLLFLWIKRQIEVHFRGMLRATKKHLNENQSQSGVSPWAVQHSVARIWSPAQVDEVSSREEHFCAGFHHDFSIWGGVCNGQAGDMKLAKPLPHLLPTRQPLFISCQLVWRVA